MSGFVPTPSREFDPACDLLFGRPNSRQKVAPAPSPLAALGVPCDARIPRLARNSLHYAALRQPREVSPRSALRARLAVLRFSAPPKGCEGTAEQPTANPKSRSHRGISLHPLSTAEVRKSRSPRAQHASRTDLRRLFEQSVAARVRRGASGLSFLGNPEGAVRSGALSLPTFLCAQESRSPAGANSRRGLPAKQLQREAN